MMIRRTLCLAKDGHKYLFRYQPGCEGEIVDAIMHLAEDVESKLEWIDVAGLSFQVARYAADDCCAALTPAAASEKRPRTGADRGAGPDDAKDGPCTSCP